MADWKTDSELYEVADQLANKIMQMYTDAGVFIPVGQKRDAVLESVRLDTETYMSLDPQKIIDEFQRMQHAARDTGEDAVARGLLQASNIKIGSAWFGEAADAFGHQMTYIEVFMQQQEAQIMFAAHSMGTLYTLAVQARRSYHDLAGATISACQKEMGEQRERDNKAMVGIFGEIAKACITGFVKPGKPSEVVRWGLETFIDIGSKTHEVLVDGSEAENVVGSYNSARQQLQGSFEDGLNQLTKWINMQENELSKDKVHLLEPLPLCTDVDSPDFSYQKFFSPERDPSSFGPRTELERRKIHEERNRPSGLIGHRLDGNES